MFWVWIPLRQGVLDTTLCDEVCQWLATGRWFSPGAPVSSTNKTDRHDIAEILLKVALNTITLTLSRTQISPQLILCFNILDDDSDLPSLLPEIETKITAYPSEAPEFNPVFSGVRVSQSLVLCVFFVDRCLSFCTFSFGHCVVCSSSIYGFWLPPFGIFKLFLHSFTSPTSRTLLHGTPYLIFHERLMLEGCTTHEF